MKYGIMIGRFQPIHNGHLKAIQHALEEECEKIIIFITGTNRPRSSENPFTGQERQTMIEESLIDFFEDRAKTPTGWTDSPHKFEILDRVKIKTVRDLYYSDQRWANEIIAEAVALGVPENSQTKLITSVQHPFKENKNLFPHWKLFTTPEYDHQLRGEQIREAMFDPKTKVFSVTQSVEEFIESFYHTKDFEDLKSGYDFEKNYKEAWECAPHVPIHVTVDSIVLCNGTILLVKRKMNPGKGLYALPGGFAKHDLSIYDGAIKEIDEETNLRIPKNRLKGFLKEVKIFDHVKRDPRGRVITHVHLFNIESKTLPEIKAGDDAKEAHWVSFHKIWEMSNVMFRDHWDIIVQMTAGH
jgi:bifunctional NMN adenylyltransferase/nudix hydrolase